MKRDLRKWTPERAMFRCAYDALNYVDWSTDGGDFWASILDSVTDVLVLVRHNGAHWAPMVKRAKTIIERAQEQEDRMDTETKAELVRARAWLQKCEKIPRMQEYVQSCC